MPTRRSALVPPLAVLGLVLAPLLLPAAARAADADPRPGVFAGSLGVAVPAGGRGLVRAVDRVSGSVVAAQRVGGNGTFRFTLPPGAYAVAATLVPKKGRPTARPMVGLTLKPGQRRTKASLKKSKRKKKPRARAAYVQERGGITPGQVAVVVHNFTGLGDEEGGYLQKSMADLVLTDLWRLANGTMSGGGKCKYTVREHARIAEVEREQAFSQSKYTDPGTRIVADLITPDVEIRGTLSRTRAPLPAGPQLQYDVRLVDARTGGELGKVTGSMSAGDWTTGEEQLARQLSKELCKLSDVYEVRLDLQGSGNFATHSATATLRSTLRARRTEGQGDSWRATGTLVWENLAFSSKMPPCVMTDPIAGSVPWSVEITDTGEVLRVTWSTGGGPAGNSTASMDCPPDGDGGDPPPTPGQPGTLLLAGPPTFTVPYGGGSEAIAGEVVDSGDGFVNAGVITVTPAGVAGPPS
jgi:hypothetical protein